MGDQFPNKEIRMVTQLVCSITCRSNHKKRKHDNTHLKLEKIKPNWWHKGRATLLADGNLERKQDVWTYI